MSFNFNSSIRVEHNPINWMKDASQDEIKNEPMLFSCDLLAARKLGGPLTRSFLNKIPSNILVKEDFIVDSRVHMLMKDWYSCIPGYHHDDVERGPNGQPNYNGEFPKSEHVMCLLNGDICPTEFALGQSEFNDIEEGQKYYKEWHKDVVQKLENSELQQFSAPSNKPIYFDWQTWHTGVKAKASGWRWFIRCSWNTSRKPVNELRRQVQVYLEHPMEGW